MAHAGAAVMKALTGFKWTDYRLYEKRANEMQSEAEE